MRPSWNEYFMFMAKVASTRSTCNSRPTGCVIVNDKRIIATGYNGSMAGVEHCTDRGPDFCYRRSLNVPDGDKYNYCRSVHSEANAVAQAAKNGVSLLGATAYLTLAPCYVCLKLLASCGVTAIYYEHEYESNAVDRDRLWKEAVQMTNITTYERLFIFPSSNQFILDTVSGVTSLRRKPATD